MPSTKNLIRTFIFLLALAPALSAADLEIHSSSVHLSYSRFQAWAPAAQKLFWREIRQAWSEFEKAAQVTLPLDSGLVADQHSHWADRFATALSILGILPNADAVTGKTCPVGGWEREMITDSRGRLWCPTGGKPCGNRGHRGFECASIYNKVCVSRYPLESLTERCHSTAGDALPDRGTFNTALEQIETIANRCRAGEYTIRLKPNCDRLSSRLTYIRGKFDVQVVAQPQAEAPAPKQPAQLRAAIPVQKPPAPQPPEKREPPTPQACFPLKTVSTNDGIMGARLDPRTGRAANPGGRFEWFLEKGNELKEKGVGLEVKGVCASSCTFIVAMLPKEHVCVTPDAALAFHEATFGNGSPDDPIIYGVMDDMYNGIYKKRRYAFSPEVRAIWKRHKPPRGSKASKFHYAYSRELQTVFPLCSEAKKRPACGSTRHRQMASTSTMVESVR